MKRIIIGSILLVLTMAAFGQSRAGAFGLTASVGYNKGSLGFEVNPIENLIIRPDVSFSWNNSTTVNNNLPSVASKKEERTDFWSYGGNLAILYTLVKAGPVEFALGPIGGITYETYTYRLPTDESVTATTVVSFDKQTLTYSGGLAGNVKFFMSPNFALYASLGAAFNTSSSKYINAKTSAGEKPSSSTTFENKWYMDTSSYGVNVGTPAVGAIFYLK